MKCFELTTRSHPLTEPCRDAEEQNIVHYAAGEGRHKFLEIVLHQASREKQIDAFWASLARDANGCSPLALAVRSESAATIKAVLECHRTLLTSPEYAQPFDDQISPQQEHPSETFPLDELCHVLTTFPEEALRFVEELKFVLSPTTLEGDRIALGNMERYEIGDKPLITGAETRVRKGYWSDMLTVTNRGKRVDAKIIPVKGIAAADSRFLHNLVQAAGETGLYTSFESELVKGLIQFKWEMFARKKFLLTLFLDLSLVMLLTLDVLWIRVCPNNKGAWVVPYCETETQGGASSLWLRVPLICLWTYFMKDELSQLTASPTVSAYFLDFWNLLDFLSLSLILGAYILEFAGINDPSGPYSNSFFFASRWFAAALVRASEWRRTSHIFVLQSCR